MCGCNKKKGRPANPEAARAAQASPRETLMKARQRAQAMRTTRRSF
jgi:hypothetical protein